MRFSAANPAAVKAREHNNHKNDRRLNHGHTTSINFHKLGALKDLGLRVAQELEKTNQKIEDIEIPEYSLVKQGTAESGYLSTYYLTKDGAQVGEKINIPKDFLVNSADILEVDTADQPYAGAQVGDLYIDFVINSKDRRRHQPSHVYLPVNELVDAYTGGNGIDISASNVVSVKIDSANANGLEVGAAGLKLNAATRQHSRRNVRCGQDQVGRSEQLHPPQLHRPRFRPV